MSMRLLTLALFFISTYAARPSEVLDRIVATVNGHVILLSDLSEELRLESFLSGNQIASITAEQKKNALDRLIDQELLREQMSTSELKPILPQQVQKQIELLKKDYLQGRPAASWGTGLSSYELTEKFLESHVEAELKQLQFIDARFRSAIQVTPDQVEQYYKNELVPHLPASDPVSLAEATPKIREILVQQKMNQTLSSWLETLRSQAQIRIFSANSTTDASSSFSSSQAGPQ